MPTTITPPKPRYIVLYWDDFLRQAVIEAIRKHGWSIETKEVIRQELQRLREAAEREGEFEASLVAHLTRTDESGVFICRWVERPTRQLEFYEKPAQEVVSADFRLEALADTLGDVVGNWEEEWNSLKPKAETGRGPK